MLQPTLTDDIREILLQNHVELSQENLGSDPADWFLIDRRSGAMCDFQAMAAQRLAVPFESVRFYIDSQESPAMVRAFFDDIMELLECVYADYDLYELNCDDEIGHIYLVGDYIIELSNGGWGIYFADFE